MWATDLNTYHLKTARHQVAPIRKRYIVTASAGPVPNFRLKNLHTYLLAETLPNQQVLGERFLQTIFHWKKNGNKIKGMRRKI